ncbi:EF-hand domain-containing protein [Pseudomonas sp. H11T01]|uniref:HvfA family oxazolone/thioamide-modified RiPP metallophore n=1 Tax=Pseudomonas sp. H11T01 TaxID=3402749 RepID=UPI003AC89F1C
MSRTTTLSKNTIGLLGAVLAGGMMLSGSVFASQPLTQGYMLASAEQVVKTPEGKCGEGKCGDASMAKTDTDGDGQVSRAEFLKVAPTHAADFDKIDVNHDGQISEQEAFDNVKSTYEANGKKMPNNLFEHLQDKS